MGRRFARVPVRRKAIPHHSAGFTQAAYGSGQPDPVAGNPAESRGVETR